MYFNIQVDPSCPDFELVYSSVEQGIVVKMSTVDVMFDRAAILYLYSFTQSLLARYEFVRHKILVLLSTVR